ncbi:hypothetical protein [Azospirillum thermophilum]|uniref:hypothetical protein n=1 Tax=Azospirillum thermophilum TaxID=2202148 RepID=UPI00143D3278|nr:hypothetical protein [Azospirillum thermophilum]
MRYILDRLSERSTWLGLIALASALGVAVTPDQAAAITSAGTALAGAVGIFTKG